MRDKVCAFLKGLAHPLVASGLGLALVLGGCSGSGQNHSFARSFPVNVGEVIQKDVPIYIETFGNAYALSTINVKPQISGVITQAPVKEGQEVKKGDVLFVIDPRPYQAFLDKARGTLAKDIAVLDFNEKRVDRYKNLVTQDYVAKLTYEEYVSSVDSSKGQIIMDKADVDTAQLNLDYAYIKSPIDGMISQYNVYPGNYVQPTDTTPITVIRQMNPIDIRFYITQSNFDSIKSTPGAGKEMIVTLPDQPANPFKGTIYFFDNNIDMATGTLLVKGTVDNESRKLWPGQFVLIKLLIGLKPHALLVPFEAVQTGQNGQFVYVVKPDKTVELRNVTTGPRVDNLIVIDKGVNLGEVIVTEGQINLRPGASVAIKNAEESKGNPQQGNQNAPKEKNPS